MSPRNARKSSRTRSGTSRSAANNGTPTPVAHVTVETPETPNKPSGPMWDALARAGKSREKIREIEADAKRQGYAENGQLRKAITARLEELD